MATATKIQLVEFNKDEALNGASLAFSSNGQLNDIGPVTEKYSGQVQKKMYYFNDNGVCSDGNELHNLFLDDGQVTLISSMAFKIAQSVMSTGMGKC